MKFGPLSNSDIEKLKELLDSQGAQYQISYSEEELHAARESKKDYRITNVYPGYSGPLTFLFIDIELKDLMIVRGELERMGFAVARDVPEPVAEVPEYLCPKCDFVSGLPGQCPQHEIPLLEFSAYAAFTKTKGLTRTQGYIVVVFCVALFLALRSCSGVGMWSQH